MPAAKLSKGCTFDSMKSGDGNDSLDTSIKQTTRKEPHVSVSRTGDNPVQWIQFFHALEQQEFAGWPLLTPLKVQMQKCEKCSREFCSLVNYRRHIRVHRRSLNFDKESHKIRDMLAAFWDKLSLEDAKEVVSLCDVTLKAEVTGPSIIKSLAASLRKPGVWTLPPAYVKAGSNLLDIVHAKPSRVPISSQELFSILDDASEGTFLRAGTAESVQKYVFDGQPGRIAFELKNLVACTSFLFEQKLVKEWLADKDAEALKCQKLLVEEEEAAQKRQAELLERKRQKKLRQKEQKTREQPSEEKVALTIAASLSEGSFQAETCIPASSSEGSLLDETCILPPPPDAISEAPYIIPDVTSFLEPVQLSNTEENNDIEALDLSSDNLDSGLVQNVETTMVSINGRRRWQVPKFQRAGRNGFLDNQKHVPAKDRVTVVNGSKVWTKKFKARNDEESLRPRLEEAVKQSDEKKCELIIGSISIPFRNCISRKKGEAQYSCGTEQGDHKKSDLLEETANFDSHEIGNNRDATKLCRPVSCHEKRGPSPVQRANHGPVEGVMLEKLEDRTASDGSCLQSSASEDDHSKSGEGSTLLCEGTVSPQGLQLSSAAAKAFLAQRWKEAISGQHVKLELSVKPEPPGCPETETDISAYAALAAHSEEISTNVDSDNLKLDAGHFSSTRRNAKAKNRTSPEKGVKIKYIPKQKVAS